MNTYFDVSMFFVISLYIYIHTQWNVVFGQTIDVLLIKLQVYMKSKCEKYSTIKVLIDRVKYPVFANKCLITNCFSVFWQQNGNFQITKQYFLW